MNAAILVVDDEQPILKMMTRILGKAGYIIHTAQNAEAAREVLRSEEIELLLCDFQMPGESGLELIRYCKENYPHIGRIMMTGFSTADIAKDIMDVGVYGYILKPMTSDVVLITLENALRHLRLDNDLLAYRRELEEEIKKRTQKLVAIMDHLNLGVMMIDSDMRVVEFNRKMSSWFKDLQVGDKAFCYQEGIEKCDREVCGSCPHFSTLETGGDYEVRQTCTTDGGKREFRIVITAMKNDDGTVYAALALYEDVTEKMILERELRLAQKLESLGQLAAGIAHEINTPVQYINDNLSFLQESHTDIAEVLEFYDKHFSQLVDSGAAPSEIGHLLKEEKEKLDLDFLVEEIPKTLNQSLEGVQRVNRIVQSMKEFSHPGSEEKSLVNVNKLLETTLTVCRNEWKYVAKAEMDLADNLPLIPGFAAELNQVFLNLLVNSAHAIGEFTNGGRDGLGMITLRTRARTGMVEIRIRDTGTGIPKQLQEAIFEPFFTTKERGRGTGQGLAIAHRVIVEKHKGRLYLESEEGAGTTFFIELPVV